MTNLSSGYVLRRDEDRQGVPLVGPNGRAIYLKVGTDDVSGAYSLQEFFVNANTPWLNPHIHHAHDEAIYVVEGLLSIRLGHDQVEAPTGSFVLIPKGTPHCHSNPGLTTTRYLALFNPAGMEHFFEELDRLLPTRQTDPFYRERLKELQARYQMESVDADEFAKFFK